MTRSDLVPTPNSGHWSLEAIVVDVSPAASLLVAIVSTAAAVPVVDGESFEPQPANPTRAIATVKLANGFHLRDVIDFRSRFLQG